MYFSGKCIENLSFLQVSTVMFSNVVDYFLELKHSKQPEAVEMNLLALLAYLFRNRSVSVYEGFPSSEEEVATMACRGVHMLWVLLAQTILGLWGYADGSMCRRI